MASTTNGPSDRQDELQRRDNLLLGVAEASRRLLVIADFDEAVHGALDAIATSSGIDRIFIYQHHIAPETQREFATCPYEWTVPNIGKACDIPGQFPMYYDEIDGYSDWVSELKAGRPVQRLAEEMSAAGQAKQVQEQPLSVLTVPIFIQRTYWGNFGFDDCTIAKIWSNAEIAVLETAAANFAGALQRRSTLAELESFNQQLQQRDALLNSVNAAAQCLVANYNLAQAIPEALRILGEGVRQDRVYVFENLIDPKTEKLLFNMPFEWVAPQVPPSIESSSFPLPADSLPDCVVQLSREGQPVQFLARELEGTALELNEEAQTLSLITVPILVAGQWWGMLGFDDCTTERVWSDAEVVVLETAATCIGNAIERDHNQKQKAATAQARAAELEAHNQVLEGRDRILEATAEAANILLTVEDFDLAVNTALQVIGKAVDTDRVGIIEHLEDPSSASQGLWQVVYEWNSPDTRSVAQIHHPELMQGTYEGAEDIFQRSRQGEGFSLTIDQLSEPFRSGQKEVGVQSMHSVPIMLKGNFWGAITFDDCRAMRLRSDAELAVLKTVADCIGSAIERERLRDAELQNRAAREAAERNVLRESEKSARDRVAELAKANDVLKDTLDTLATELELERFLGYVLKAIAQQFNAPFLEYWRHEENVAYLELAVVNSEVLVGDQLAEHHGSEGYPVPLPLISEGKLVKRTRHIEAELSLDHPLLASVVPKIWSWCEQQGIASPVDKVMNFPVILGEKSAGAIAVFLPQGQTFAEHAVQLGYALTNQVALAIQLTKLAEEAKQVALLEERDRISQQRAIELSQVNNVLKDSLNRLASDHDLDVFLGHVVDTINQQVGATSGYIFLHEPETDTLAIRLSVRFGKITMGPADYDAPIFQTPTPVNITPVYSWVCQAREIYLARMDDQNEAMFWPGTLEWHRHMGHKQAGMLALRKGDQPIGFLGLSFAEKTDLTPEDKELIFALTDQASLASQLAHLAEENKQTAVIQEREQFAHTRTTELKDHNRVLEQRDRILEATAAAANVMLTDTDFDSAINTALQIVGEGLDVDRINLGEYFEATSLEEVGYHHFLYEWTSAATPTQINHTELANISDHGIQSLVAALRKGETFGGIVDELSEPFRSGQLELGVKSTYAIPIKVDAHYWGMIGFDDCHRLTRRSEAELEALKTLANCIGNAIDRDRARKEREAATQARAIELETFNQQLQQRDGLLNSVNAAAQCLVANEDLAVALPVMLKILGEGTGQCRAYILQNSQDEKTGEPLFNLTFEWNAPGIPTKREAGGRFPVPVNIFPGHLTAPLKAGRATQFLARDLDGHDERDQGQALSLVGVPITVEGEWWGLLGLDDCIDERVWSEAEIAVLETAATSIGSALERDLTREAREAAERDALLTRERAARAAELEVANQILSTREQWLDATAAAANELLSTADVDASVNAALKTIGVNLSCDRIGIMKHFSEPTALGYFRILYEWDSPNTQPQIADPELKQLPANIFENWTRQLISGHSVGGVVDELDDPFRSTMQRLNTLSTYAVPMFVEAEFWGFMFMDHCQEVKQLTPSELAVFKTAATCIGSAIYRDRMRFEREQVTRDILLQQEREQAAQKRAAELAKANESLNRTLGVLAESPELQGFLGYLLAELAQQTGACKTHLFLYDAETHTLNQHCTVQDGHIYIGAAPTDPDMFQRPIPADLTGAWQAILDTPYPLSFNELGSLDSEDKSLWWPESIPWHRQEGHHNVACARMKVGDQPVGYIGFAFSAPADLTDGQLEFIQALTNQATLAIQLTRLAEQNQSAALVNERNRLAREIHDTLAQTFTGISLQLEAVRGITTPEPGSEPVLKDFQEAQTYIRRARDLARTGLSEARRSVRSLRSAALETETLPDALRKTLLQTARDTGLETHFYLEGNPIPLPDDIQLNLLRISQEAVTNTLRYAQATQLDLTLTFTAAPNHQRVQLRIIDNGKGFDTTRLPETIGFGLLGIRERIAHFDGTFELLSTPNIGTTLDIVIPLPLT